MHDFGYITIYGFPPFFVKPACDERDIVVTISVQCMYIVRECKHAWVHPDLSLCMNFKIIWPPLLSLRSRKDI